MKQNHHCLNIPSFFRDACESFSQTCRNDGNPLKLKLQLFIDCCLPNPILSFTPSYWFIQLQNCFDNRNVDDFLPKTFVVLCMVSMKLKTVFEYALWLAQTSIFKNLLSDVLITQCKLIKKTFSPMTNVLKQCKI